MDLLDTLLAHNQETTQCLIEHSASLAVGQLDQDFDLGFRTVRLTLHHIIDSMEWWTDLMNAQPKRSFEVWSQDPLSLTGLELRLKTVTQEFAQAAQDVSQRQVWDERWPTRGDQQRSYRYGATVAHVLTHGAHHRSQVIHMLKRMGVEDVIWGDALGF